MFMSLRGAWHDSADQEYLENMLNLNANSGGENSAPRP